jgi:inositol transporter-like SP family MFS transporter
MVFIAVGSALATFAGSFTPILAGLVFMGLGIGADLPTSMSTISEAATDKNRGAIVSMTGPMWIAGIISAILIASFTGSWGQACAQLLLGQVGGFAVIVFVARLPIPESSVWLAQRDRRRTLGPEADGTKARVRDLLKPPYLVPVIGLTVQYSLMNIGANTTGSFNSFIAVNYANTTVEAYNQWALLGMGVSIAGAAVFMRTVDTKLRMPLFAVGGVILLSSYMIYFLAGFSITTMVMQLGLSAIGNCFCFEGMIRVWQQENFPTLLRSTAQGAITAVARVVAALAATVTPAMLAMSASGAFLILGGLAAIGLVVAFLVFRKSGRNEFKLEIPAQTAHGAATSAEAS